MKQKYFKLLISFFTLCLLTTYINAADEPSGPIKIMPLGDSITYDYILADADNPRPIGIRTAYRSHLWYMLRDANVSADFVGSVAAGQDITPPFDIDNEGHRGWHSLEIAERTYDYMMNSAPDTVLLHAGTNDNSTSAAGIAAILDQINMYEQHSGRTVRVIVALIIDRREPDAITAAFNEDLRKIVNNYMLLGDKVTLVDMYRGAGLTSADYTDRLHPNTNGYIKIAAAWFNALMAPYTPELYTFPATVVNPAYVTSLNVSEASRSVTFVAEVPDTGITF